jgi:hypothetical protein
LVRQVWLTDLITQVHAESFGVYGAPRVHAELTLGRGIVVGHRTSAHDSGLVPSMGSITPGTHHGVRLIGVPSEYRGRLLPIRSSEGSAAW